jgi:hypothetical protein
MWTRTVVEIARSETDFVHVDDIGGRQGRRAGPEGPLPSARTGTALDVRNQRFTAPWEPAWTAAHLS